MFSSISQAMQERMAYLEAADAHDRLDGTPRMQRLRQVPSETGRFLALLAASAPEGQVLEIGASGGYSGMWLALACRQRGDGLVTFEVLAEKARIARETFISAGVASQVKLILGDARDHLADYLRIAFCFLDAEKENYTSCYELVVPNLVQGGFLVADNFISHRDELQPVADRAVADQRVDAMVVPLGKGLLVCRKA